MLIVKFTTPWLGKGSMNLREGQGIFIRYAIFLKSNWMVYIQNAEFYSFESKVNKVCFVNWFCLRKIFKPPRRRK